MKRLAVILLILGLLGTACVMSSCTKQEKTIAGSLIGIGAGAAIGSAAGNTGGALIGGALGGITGGLIGRSMGDDE